jgi:rhomboid protease GluP
MNIHIHADAQNTKNILTLIEEQGFSLPCNCHGAHRCNGALLVMLVVGNRGRLSSEVPRYILYLAISLYSGMQDPTIDNAAHIGGFVAGAVICLCMTRFIRMEVSYES